MSIYRDDEEIAPFAVGGNLLADAVGYIVGGIALMIDTAANKSEALAIQPR